MDYHLTNVSMKKFTNYSKAFLILILSLFCSTENSLINSIKKTMQKQCEIWDTQHYLIIKRSKILHIKEQNCPALIIDSVFHLT